MKLALFLLMTFPLAQAQVFPFTMDQEEFKIQRYEYVRYIRPQMKSIVGEFHDLLRQFYPVYRKLTSLRSKLLLYQRKARAWSEVCLGKVHDNCEKGIKDLHQQLLEVSKLITELNQKELDEFRQTGLKKQLPGTHFLKYQNFLSRLSAYTQRDLAIWEQALIFFNTSTKSYFSFADNIRAHGEKYELTLNMHFLDLFDDRLKNIFYLVWKDFIIPIERHVLLQDNKIFLKRRLEQLNFTWNSFHQTLVKQRAEDLKSKKELVSRAKTIHNRWNSILKVLLN